MGGEFFWRDVKFGLRALVRNRAFTVVSLITLGLGIGANAAIFSVVNAVLLRPLPFPDSGRIVIVWKTEARRNITKAVTSPAEYLDWRERNHSFEQLAGWTAGYCNLEGTAGPEQVLGVRATANLFDVFQVKPVAGRSFLPEEEQPGHDQVAILSYRLWQERFGGSPDALGRSLTVNNKPFTIVGVLPAGLNLSGKAGFQYDVWMPFAFDRGNLDRDQHLLIVFGRLKPGVRVAQADVELKTIVRQLKLEYPAIDPEMDVRIAQLQEESTRALRPALEMLLAVAGLVLLVACVNMANLLLSRATSREREMAVRASMGAGRGRLVLQLLTESTLLSLAGGGFGLLLAFGGLRFLPLLLPPAGSRLEIPYAQMIRIDPEVLMFTLVVSIAVGIVFGLAPAFQVSQTRLSEALKEGGRGSAGSRRANALRKVLVVMEIGVSLLLLAGGGLLARSFLNALSENLGYDPQNLLTQQISLPTYRYQKPEEFAQFFHQAGDRLKALPGVESAGMINYLPLTGWRGGCFANFQIAGTAPRARGDEFTAECRVIDANYPATMRIPLLKGRLLTDADAEQGQGVTLVNAALASHFFPTEDPIGKQIRFLPGDRGPLAPVLRDSWVTIVGVIGDTVEGEIGETRDPIFFLPYLQNPSRVMRLVIRTPSEPTSLAAAVRHEVGAVDKDQPVTDVKTMQDYVAAVASQRRLNMALVALFAVLATTLAGAGIYGVMSYSVTQQIHDLGIRMALGAQPQDVLRLVVSQGMRLALIGILAGLVGGIFILRGLLAPLLFGLTTTDPVTLGATAMFVAAIALAACYLPARRATRVDPLTALRYE
ncbi:MAG TPA: ABC transporter permease [Candidatus Acidoferrales bacterium]|nr:ABC transporter permease [Candidatus Acidoferrales bacterium]